MQGADNLMNDLRAVIADAEELLRGSAGEAGEHVKGAGAELDSRVRAHPWAAVGIAAAIGLVAGILLSRK